MKLGWQHFIDHFAFWRPIHQCLSLHFMKWAVPIAPDLGCEHNVVVMCCWEVHYTMVWKGIVAMCCNTRSSRNFFLLPHDLWCLHLEWCFNFLTCWSDWWFTCHMTNKAKVELLDQILAVYFYDNAIILLVLCSKESMLGLKYAKAMCLGRTCTFTWSLSTSLCILEIEIWNFGPRSQGQREKSSRKLATEAI